MKKHIQFLCLLFAFLLCFTSCENNNQPIESSSEKETETKIDGTCIVENGVANYKLIYPQYPTNDCLNAAQKFVKLVKDKTGVDLDSGTDEIKRNRLHDSTTKEILFGRTNYEETNEVLSTLKDGQFAFVQKGNKLVFVAKLDTYLDEAVTYFEQWITQNELLIEGNKKSLLFKEFSLDAVETGEPIFNGKKLSEYTIVYEYGNLNWQGVAEELQKQISDNLGYNLKIYKDKVHAENGKPEILIGRTNRKESTDVYAEETVELMSYRMVVRGNKILFASGGVYSGSMLVSDFAFVLNSKKQEDYADGCYLEKTLHTDITDLATNTDFRIMSANIAACWWAEDYNDQYMEVDRRAEIFASILAVKQPDIIGIQEACDRWQTALKEYLKIVKEINHIEYSWELTTYAGKQNLTSIMYRSDRYTLLEKGVEVTPYWLTDFSDRVYHAREVCWAEFQSKTTGKKMVLANTHWSPVNDDITAAYQVQDVNWQVTTVNNLLEQFKVPVFCTGDFNCIIKQGQNLTDLMTRTPLKWTHDIAEENNVLINNIGGTGNINRKRILTVYIDLILGAGSYDVLRYETVLDNYSMYISDHSPQIADIQFK